MLAIVVRDDVSINQLLKLARTRPIVKTPHVGNNSLNNLWAARCGFPILWSDTTIPSRDKNANPHLLIKDGHAHALSNNMRLRSILTTHAVVEEYGFEAHGFVPGSALVTGHLQKMRKLFPETEVSTMHEKWRLLDGMAYDILEAATDTMPDAWYRFVNNDGTFCCNAKDEPNGVRSWHDVKNNLFLEPDVRTGWVIPNIYNVLIHAIWQASTSGIPEAWMLSGPDMVRYLPEMKRLPALHNAVSRRIGYAQDLTIHLVPFSSFRLVVRREQANALDAFLDFLDRKGVSTCNPQKMYVRAAACPDLWRPTEKRRYFSQHDMQTVDDIYAPPRVFDWPLARIEALWKKTRITLRS